VAELLRDGRRIDAADEEDRGERVCRSLWAMAPSRSGCWPRSASSSSARRTYRADDALAGVVLVAARAGGRREGEVVRPGARVRVAVRGQLVAQRREDADLADARLGLGRADGATG
jgi:hypothetical protein